MENVKLVDNSNVIDSKKPDPVKLGFSDGATLEAPIGYSKPYEKIDVLHSFMGGNKKDFDASVGVMRQARESGDETLKLGAILNAITALDPSLGDVPNDYIIETFMGVGKTAKDAEQYLEDISKLTEQSDENALADFDKLGADEQRKRVEANSSDLKRNKTVTGIYGTVTEDNPDFDYEKAREEYRDMLEARNTFKTFAKLRNAGFDNRVIRDVIRFKTAFETRNAAADVYAENILTEDEEYVKQFMAAVNAFSPEVRRGFFDRVMTRIAEDFGDRWGNIRDYLLDSNSDGIRFYERARKMKLIDGDGNLIADRQKVEKLRNAFEEEQNIAANRAIGGRMLAKAYANIDAQKLFNEGKREFERRKLVRELMNANRTRFEKSGAVSETLEEALVNGFVSLEYLGLTLGVSAATGNPLAGVAASSAMMYLDEASNMYEDLRYDGNVDEATAAAASALYGVVASGLEQVQVRGLGRTFVGGKARYSNFREYVAYGIKKSLKDLGKEAGVQTATELATSVDAYMTKKFAADFADATYDEEELFNEFRDECSMLVKTMPLITLGFWGAGAPYRARAHLGEVGAKIGSGVKAFFSSADVLNNNAKSLGVIKLGEEYDAQIKSKYGRTERGREFLSKFFDAKDAAQRDSVLAEYYPDVERREEVKLELEAADKATKEAQTEVIKRGLEIAKKRMEDDAALQNGDTVDISVLDGKDENGEYAVLESAIDFFGMRENVVFVESAQELSDVSGVSLKTAEEQMSRKGAMGFTSMSNGKIIILKPHLRNGADALQTFVHEYGHKIMKSIRTNDLGGYNRMCDDVLDILGGEGLARMTLPESYSNEKSIQYIADSRAVAEEILMRVVERVATKKAIDAKSRGVWARVKAWFKSLFDEKTFAEIADEKLAQMALDVLQREKKFEVNAADIKPSNRWRAKTPENNGEEVSGQWRVADASELLTSTDEGFDDKLQPRNRSRQASKEQTSDIAVNLDPERLNDSVTSDLGAPIVDSRGMVLSGNGRTLAIRQAYASEKSERADAYRQFVEKRAREMGIEIPDNVKNPVLVRRVDDFGKMSAEEFAARSNKSQVAGMSVAEQAIADGRRILAADLLDYFFPDVNGNVLASSNTDFVNAFLEQVGGSEMYRNSDGSIRSNLSPRIKAAVLAAMLDSDNRETVERLLDNPEGFNALVGGLMQSAANLAELSGKPEYDISEELSQAVELFVEMRNKGMKLADFSAQGDFFRAAPSDEVMFLMGLFEENPKTPSGISGVLRQYAGECKKIDTTTMDMFGTENPSKIEKLEQARDHYAADIAQQDSNADLRGKYEEEGFTPEEIREAQRQKDEVKAKWTNPDGTMKKGYHCAPNGKPSRLSEDQWLLVRTPNFKRWFGDWEKSAYANAAMDFLENTAPVKELTGGEFQKSETSLTDRVAEYFDSIGNVAHNEELGDVVLDKEGIHDSIGHGLGRLKASAFMAVKDVIEHGFIFNRETNWKNRQWDSAVVVAPVKIGSENYVCEVIVARHPTKNKFYLHEVEIKRTLEEVFKTPTKGRTSQASKLILGKHLAEVKGNVSQVVDENGEPLVVYHGTDWKPLAEKAGDAVFKDESYFSASRTYANRYKKGGEVYSFFLNARKPFDTRNSKEREIFENEFYGKWGNGAPLSERGLPDWTDGSDLFEFLQEKGYDYDSIVFDEGGDGGYGNSVSYRGESYVPLNSNQIKSATENVGTYNRKNPDIRWSIREDSEIEKINRQFRDLYDRYKGGDQAAYGEAVKMVADYAKSKGYDVKVYHGTGADGFNVAKADASEAQNGEGNQAHGMGLYLATSKSTSERYRKQASKSQKLVYLDHEKYEHVSIAFDKLSEKTQKYLTGRFDRWRGKTLDELEKQLRDTQRQVEELSADKEKFGAFMRTVFANAKAEVSALKEFIPYIKENKLEPAFFATQDGEGKLFDWFTNLKPENVLDEDKTLKEQNEEVQGKLWELWSDNVLEENEDSVYVEDHSKFQSVLTEEDYQKLLDAFEGDGDIGMRFLQEAVRRLAKDEDIFASDNAGSEYFLKHGIKGITYDGRQDGRCYVSFEGGSAVKLQDPFTFDDNGQLIPLSERFDSGNPDMRWKDDTGFSPIEVKRELLAQKKIVIKSDENTNRILGEFSAQEKGWVGRVVKILSGILPKSVMSRIGEVSISNGSIKSALYHSRGALKVQVLPQLEEIISDSIPITREPIARNDGQLSYPMSRVIEWNKVPYVMTSVILEDKNGKRFYNHELTEIKRLDDAVHSGEDLYPRASEANKHHRALNGILYNDIWNVKENDGENSSRLRFLLRQDRTENPVIWASIVLAKEIYLGRKITASKLETVLPSAKFDGTKREYAVARAREIANRYKINKEKFGEKLDVGLQRAENDLYWRRDVMDEMYASFRADGEEYGYIKARLKEWLKDERRRDLEKIRGLKPDEIGFDVVDAIENAMDAEPERPKPSEKQEETEDEDLDEAETSGGGGAELSDNRQTDERFDTRGIIAKIRMAATKTAKQKDLDEPARRRLYRNTLVETLTDAAKKLSFGIERERILGKIAELAGKPYVAIKLKDGDRAGQIVDNYTLRAEHIAMRIFNRGVWDNKKVLLEKFESIVKRVKAPKRVERDDKRRMAGKAQERAYLIKQIAHMPLNSDDKTIKSVEGEIENALTAINRADSDIANDYHAKLMDAVRYLEDLQRFGALREKSRAEMAEAVDWLEKYIEDETAAQEDKVEKLKTDAEHRRKVFVEAINEISRNAAFDGKARESLRLLFNSASTFKDLLLGLGRAATGEKFKEFKGLVDSMMDDCYAATAQKENEVFRHQEELSKAVSEIYGMKPADAFKRILGGNAELQKFSVQGKPMSVQIALQRLSEAEQGNYQNNVFLHCVSKSEEVKALEERIAELNGEEPTEAARTQIAEMELRLQSLKRDAVERYAEELRGALSEQDLRLLDWFREFYRRERPSLSNANEIITGLGIPEVDPFYTPMKMLREGGTNEKHQVVAIVPKSLSPRVPNSLDIDESFGIVDIWNDRVNENAHYKAFSQLNIEWRGIFAHADFHKAVAAKLGKNVLTQVLDHFNDIMSVNLGSGLKIDTIDKLNGVYAIAALGFNLGSGLRQITGVPAFANFIGVKKSLEYAKSCLSKDGRRAAVEILNSETAKRRMQSGNNQILVEALNNIDGNKFWGWYKRNAMFFNKWGDIIPIITIGQGIYRSKTEEYAKTMPIDDAKKKAMDEMWAIAEASQQSPSVMNMGTWQRRGGSFGKMAGLFISSPQLMLSREIEAFNRFNEVRKKYRANPKDAAVRADYLAARRELAKTFLINHVFVQGGYMLATVLWKGLLGDDWDDDDWAAIIAESVAGPFGGLVVFGRFVSAIYSNYSVSVAPIEGFGRTLKSSADLFLDLIRLDGDEVLKDLDRMGKSLFSPYRDASKLYKNATDDKEGMFW